MKKKYHYSLLICAILLTACQPKSESQDTQDQSQPASAVPQKTTPRLEGEIVKVQVELPECDGNTCPDFQVEHLHSNFAWIDQILDQKILAQLEQILDITEIDKTASSIPQSEKTTDLTVQLQPYANAFAQLDDELKSLSSAHQISLMIKPKILQTQGNIVTIVLNSNSYLGGAHGSTAQHYYHFDLENQKQIQLSDLLLPKQKTALKHLAHEAFKTWVVDAKLANNADEYEQAWSFSMTDNFLLGKQGLILQYGEYEVAPYVAGLPRLVIPFEQLRGILKPEYLPQENVSSTSTPVIENQK